MSSATFARLRYQISQYGWSTANPHIATVLTMNRVCPACDNEVFENGNPVPIEENDKIGTLHFCSGECRSEFVEQGGPE